jgi:hypothetical protein
MRICDAISESCFTGKPEDPDLLAQGSGQIGLHCLDHGARHARIRSSSRLFVFRDTILLMPIGGPSMHQKTVDLQETPTNLQDLLSLVRTGTEILLTEGTTPLARVVPIISSSMHA